MFVYNDFCIYIFVYNTRARYKLYTRVKTVDLNAVSNAFGLLLLLLNVYKWNDEGAGPAVARTFARGAHRLRGEREQFAAAEWGRAPEHLDTAAFAPFALAPTSAQRYFVDREQQRERTCSGC